MALATGVEELMRTGKTKAALWLMLLCGASGAAPGAEPAPLPSPAGLKAMAHPERLPFFYPPGTQTLQFSSHDLSGGNADGHFANAFVKYTDARGEHVIFDAFGPGALYRHQLNVWSAFAGRAFVLKPGAGKSRIRYYFDDEEKPRIDLSIDEFFGGRHPLFGAPLSFTGDWSVVDLGLPLPTPPSGPIFGIQYYPLPFARRLKVTFVPSPEYAAQSARDTSSWYQFTYLLYPPDTRVASWRGEAVPKRLAAAWTSLGADPKPRAGNDTTPAAVAVAPGGTATLYEAKGQAAIAALRLRMSPWSADSFFNVRVRMSWDGAAPAVDMPIGVFFGGGGEDLPSRGEVVGKTLHNLFYGFDGKQGSFYAYWPMPFWRSARIEIVNNSASPVQVDGAVERTPKEVLAYPADEAGYFHAKQTKDADPGDALFARIFREQGLGHVVGRTLYSSDYAMDGDEFTYIDGARTPQMHGDGTEDDHNQAWGGGPYRKPLWGGVVNGYQGAYRLHANDPYVFEDEIRIDYEHSKLFRSSRSRTDATVYYYKAGLSPRALAQTDSVDVGQPESEAAHGYRVEGQTWSGSLRSAYDRYEKGGGDAFLEDGRAFKGRSSFTVAVHPANVGVRLRRLLSRHGNGVQTADVYVDGVKVERPWHTVFSASAPAHQAFADSDFELPASLTRGKSSLRIELRYAGASEGEVNEFHYWVLSHLPPRTF